uniref:hypothetical protein n=1 Tax=Escherichia coli TaxID=562 RepID=UPI001F42BA19|nr:hypothetical protein [Escherichia coli]UGK56121.1 hypothetical protein [Escherichia coli]
MQKCLCLFSWFLANCSFAYAGSDDGAFGDIWAYMSEALTGAPGKIIACGMLFSVAYFGVVKPNLGFGAGISINDAGYGKR